MPPSDLKKTIKGFSDRFKDLTKQPKTNDLCGKIEFSIVTNVWEAIVIPKKLNNHRYKNDLQIIKEAILHHKIEPYISDVIIVLEAVKKVDRANFLKSYQIKNNITNKGFKGEDSDGLPINKISVNLSSKFDQHSINIQLSTAIQNAFKLGFKLIKVNRVGFPKVENHYYKLLPTAESIKKVDIWSAFTTHNLGSAQAEKLGNTIKKTHPEYNHIPDLFLIQ